MLIIELSLLLLSFSVVRTALILLLAKGLFTYCKCLKDGHRFIQASTNILYPYTVRYVISKSEVYTVAKCQCVLGLKV